MLSPHTGRGMIQFLKLSPECRKRFLDTAGILNSYPRYAQTDERETHGETVIIVRLEEGTMQGDRENFKLVARNSYLGADLAQLRGKRSEAV